MRKGVTTLAYCLVRWIENIGGEAGHGDRCFSLVCHTNPFRKHRNAGVNLVEYSHDDGLMRCFR